MTDQDTRYSARFPSGNMSTQPAVTVANFPTSGNTTLAGYTPVNDNGVFNNSMLSDIGRAMVYGPETQDNVFAKYMTTPLARGNADMSAVFQGYKSKAYDPLVGDSALFNATKPQMLSSVVQKNVERTVDVEINDSWLKQFVQSAEMIPDAQAAIMANLNASYLDDMYALSNEYFLGSTHGAVATQSVVISKKPGESGFEDAMLEELYNTATKDFKWKSTKFNALGYNTKSDNIDVILDKSIEYKTFRKTYADTFHPDYIKIQPELGFVDSVPGTVAGAPENAGALLGIVCDRRALEILPMPDAIQVDTFRNGARHSTSVFETFSYGLGIRKMFNLKYIFAAE